MYSSCACHLCDISDWCRCTCTHAHAVQVRNIARVVHFLCAACQQPHWLRGEEPSAEQGLHGYPPDEGEAGEHQYHAGCHATVRDVCRGGICWLHSNTCTCITV